MELILIVWAILQIGLGTIGGFSAGIPEQATGWIMIVTGFYTIGVTILSDSTFAAPMRRLASAAGGLALIPGVIFGYLALTGATSVAVWLDFANYPMPLRFGIILACTLMIVLAVWSLSRRKPNPS